MQLIQLGRLLPESGKHHQYQVVYGPKGLCPALLSVNYKDPVRILVRDSNNVHKTGN